MILFSKPVSILHENKKADILYKILKKALFIQIVLSVFYLLLFQPSSFLVDRIATKEENSPIDEIFTLNQNIKSLFFSELDKTLRVFHRYQTPGSEKRTQGVFIKLYPEGEFLELLEGKTLFLTFDGNRFFATDSTSELGLTLENITPKKAIFSTHWGGKIKKLEKAIDHQYSSDVYQYLNQSKVYKPDQLYEVYGCSDDQSYQGHCRLFINDQPPLWIKEGDFLYEEEGCWKVSLDVVRQGEKIVQVDKIDQEGLSLKLWDPKGFDVSEIRLIFQNEEELIFRPEELFSKIAERSQQSVVCKLGGKSFFLKKGDWLIKVGSFWKLLKNQTEVEEMVLLKTPRELFVFDGLEICEGKTMFKGTLFDRMRTHIQRVSLPVWQMQNKKQKKDSVKSFKGREFLQEKKTQQHKEQRKLDEIKEQEQLLKLTAPSKHEFSKS